MRDNHGGCSRAGLLWVFGWKPGLEGVDSWGRARGVLVSCGACHAFLAAVRTMHGRGSVPVPSLFSLAHTGMLLHNEIYHANLPRDCKLVDMDILYDSLRMITRVIFLVVSAGSCRGRPPRIDTPSLPFCSVSARLPQQPELCWPWLRSPSFPSSALETALHDSASAASCCLLSCLARSGRPQRFAHSWRPPQASPSLAR